MDSPAPCPSGIVRDNLNPQASSMAPPAAPRIDSWRCDPRYSLGRNKGRFSHSLKVANRSGLVAEGSPARCEASAKRAATTHRGIPKGAALGAPLVTFPATGKSPGCRAERLLVGAGATSRGYQPRKSPGVEGRSAPSLGAVGAVPPQWGAGAKSDDLLPRGRSPLASFSRNAPFPPGPCARRRGGRGRPARSRRSPAPGC